MIFKILIPGILVCFSLKNNLNRLIDTQREQEGIFKSFEGVRFCIMYCVVVCHTGILKASVPVANVEYLEKVIANFTARQKLILLIRRSFLIH